MTLRGFFQWAVDVTITVWRQMFPQFRIAFDTSSYVFQEQLDRAYNALPAEQRNDPKINADYQAAKAVLPKSQDNIIDNAKKLADDVGQWMTNTYMNITPATPDTALQAATTLVALDAAKDISIGLAGLASEVVSAGQLETTTDFFKFLRAKTGYGGAMTLLMKAPVELGIIRPLSYQLHKNFRTTYIDSSTAMRLWTKGYITDEQMQNAFAYEGYSETLAQAQIQDIWRELRLGELAWAFNDATLDDVWLEKRLRYARYAPEDRAAIAKMLKDKYLKAYRDRVASQLRNQYKEGYLSAQQFRIRLANLGLPVAVRELLIQEADALFLVDYNTDLVNTYLLQYKNDIINEDQLRGNLSSVIVDPARVEAQVAKAKAARKPEKIAPPKQVQQGIRVASKPSWSSIVLDGIDTGKLTPDTIITTVGTHELRIEADGYEAAVYNFTLAAGQFVEVYAKLVPVPLL